MSHPMQYRFPIQTGKRISEVSNESDPKKALEGIIDIYKNYPSREVQKVTKYDSETGKPIETEWIPSEDEYFSPRIFIKGEGMSRQTEDLGLSERVANFVKEQGPVLLNSQFGKYVFRYEEKVTRETAQNESWNARVEYIHFNKIKTEL